MKKEILIPLQGRYSSLLRDDILKFWLTHGLDKAHGGYYTCLDRDGSLIDRDKSVWFQGRMSWIFSQYYNHFERNQMYLDAAESGVRFLENHGYDKEGDGRMFFRVSEEGQPLVKRLRYFFSETFTLMAYASYARATGNKEWIEKARILLREITRLRYGTSTLVAKFNQGTRPSRGFAEPMIMLNTLAQLREADKDNEEEYNKLIGEEIDQIPLFLSEEYRCVLEQTGDKGQFQDHYEGRLLNPGHALEGAWFILKESQYQNSEKLKNLGLKMLDWMWEWGWDKEFGGIIYYRDALGKPSGEYWHDMKFWWPQNEAAIANLTAWDITGDEIYFKRFLQVDSWAHEHFHDQEFGEWYGYLHRDGSLSSRAKGTLYKGGFHVPRMYMVCLEIFNRQLNSQEHEPDA